MTEAMRWMRGGAKRYLRIRILRTWFPDHYDTITSDCVNLTVPGLPQIFRPVLVSKKDALQDQ